RNSCPAASWRVSRRANVTRVSRCVCGHVECVLARGPRHPLSQFMVVLEQLVAWGPLESSGYEVLARERDDGLGQHGVGSTLFIELVVLSPDEARRPPILSGSRLDIFNRRRGSHNAASMRRFGILQPA